MCTARFRPFSDPLPDQNLLLFEFLNLRLIGADDARHVRLNDPFQELADLPVHTPQLGFQSFDLRFGKFQPVVPEAAQHGGRHLEQPLGRLSGFQERFELALDHVPPDRLAVVRTVPVAAVVIRVAGM
ncbi:hypothetical protein [Aurantimonas sp. VKM B-3413]|uniref:hypothetical protein n=1 Tax=Aurantimonas sp. VKM B-3413 TaxID=2779401 RepID=UPI001E57E81E|nr:hypothetical protein [Aurantimonas sp. VKM B-3413]MCB8838091.1 hypothetical protein [Aurantimonas sp. VKM B-3413]